MALTSPLFGDVSLAFFGLGATEFLVILVIVILLFGGAKLPALGRSFRQAISEFKKAKHEETAGDAPSPDVNKHI